MWQKKIEHLQEEIPKQTNFFLKAYESATAKEYGYLLVSVHSQSKKEYALSTSTFPNEPTIVYKAT